MLLWFIHIVNTDLYFYCAFLPVRLSCKPCNLCVFIMIAFVSWVLPDQEVTLPYWCNAVQTEHFERITYT